MVDHHLGSPQQPAPAPAVSRSPPGSLASVLSPPPPPLASPPSLSSPHHPLHQHHLMMQHQQQLSPHQQLRQPAGAEAGSQGSPAASHGSPAPASASPATSNPASNPEWEDPYCATSGIANGCRSGGSRRDGLTGGGGGL